jgi:hypothetical protein
MEAAETACYDGWQKLDSEYRKSISTLDELFAVEIIQFTQSSAYY